ncbi:m124.1 protein [Murid betaherpesvirus 1]|nr:m124.1 protein [Murid betaherpesvirus 1]
MASFSLYTYAGDGPSPRPRCASVPGTVTWYRKRPDTYASLPRMLCVVVSTGGACELDVQDRVSMTAQIVSCVHTPDITSDGRHDKSKNEQDTEYCAQGLQPFWRSALLFPHR